jgi:catechol 2,3-dioxygenase-like lactoylglutathione lyase family enzyme
VVNPSRRSVAPVRKLVAAVVGTIAVFVMLFGLGMSSWAIVALGAAMLALAIGLALVNVVRRGGRAWVQGTAHVVSASEPPPSSDYGRCELQLVVAAPGLPASAIKVRDPRVPVVKWPDAGATLPVMVAVDDMRHVRIQWDEVMTHTEAMEDPQAYVDPLRDLPVDDLLPEPEAPPWVTRDRQGWARPDDPQTVTADLTGPLADLRERPVAVRETPGGPIVLEGTLVDADARQSTLPRRPRPSPHPRPRTGTESDPVSPAAAAGPVAPAAAGAAAAPEDPAADPGERGTPTSAASSAASSSADDDEKIPDVPDDLSSLDPHPAKPSPTPGPAAAGPTAATQASATQASAAQTSAMRSGPTDAAPDPEVDIPLDEHDDPPASAPAPDDEPPTVGAPAAAAASAGLGGTAAADEAADSSADQSSAAQSSAAQSSADRARADEAADYRIDELNTVYPSARPGPAGAIHGVGITVLVTDLTRSTAFYRDMLGFFEIDSGGGSAVLASGDTRLVLRTVHELSPTTGRLIYLNLEVGDVDAVHEELRAKGVTFVHGPRAVNRGERLELWAASFHDPDGHNIAVTQWRSVT